MKKVQEYQAHADECREMTRTASQQHQLENMVATWQQLSDAHKKQLEKDSKSKNDQ